MASNATHIIIEQAQVRYCQQALVADPNTVAQCPMRFADCLQATVAL